MTAEQSNVDLMSTLWPIVCNLMSVKIQQFCDGLTGLLREYWGARSTMKFQEPTRRVRDEVVEKFKAGLGYKKDFLNFEHLQCQKFLIYCCFIVVFMNELDIKLYI